MNTLKDRDIEKAYHRKQFTEKLRRMADAIESQRPFAINVAGQRLRIPANATFTIEHEREGKSEELEFQLQWNRNGVRRRSRREARPERRS